MIRNGEFYVLKHMKQQGMSTARIAEELGRDLKTISKWLKADGPQSYERRKRRPSILEPFKAYILRMEEGCLNAVVLL